MAPTNVVRLDSSCFHNFPLSWQEGWQGAPPNCFSFGSWPFIFFSFLVSQSFLGSLWMFFKASCLASSMSFQHSLLTCRLQASDSLLSLASILSHQDNFRVPSPARIYGLPKMDLMIRSWLVNLKLSATCSGIRREWSIPISSSTGPPF
jgi:hypothetical protein